jgi:hypothetical protein
MSATFGNVAVVQSWLPSEIGSETQSTRDIEKDVTRGRVESEDRITRVGQPTSVNRGDKTWWLAAIQTCWGRNRESLKIWSRRIGHNVSKHGRLFGQFIPRKPFKKHVVA